MAFDNEYIRTLLIEKFAGTIGDAENEWIEALLEEEEEVRVMWEDIQQQLGGEEGDKFLARLDDEQSWNDLSSRLKSIHGSRRSPSRNLWIAGAALVALCLAVPYVFHAERTTSAAQNNVAVSKAPGTVQLLPAEGEPVDLSDTGKRNINIGTAQLAVNGNRLDYTAGKDGELKWNTLIVPARMDYRIRLDDGTEVWLNSSSTLRFPFSFSGKNREVYLTGEACFKVADDPGKPFIVHTGETDVRVLGTTFNVNAYHPDGATTSLVQGKVIVQTGEQISTLTPGMQVQHRRDRKPEMHGFDAEVTLSWMQGVQYFHNAPLEDIAGILLRWFDVKIVFDRPDLALQTFSGGVDKKQPIQVFLDNLKMAAGIAYYFKDGELHLK